MTSSHPQTREEPTLESMHISCTSGNRKNATISVKRQVFWVKSRLPAAHELNYRHSVSKKVWYDRRTPAVVMKEIRLHGDGRSFWKACTHKRKQPEFRCTVNVNGLISAVVARRDSWLLRASAGDCFPSRVDKTFIPTIPRGSSSNRFTEFSPLTAWKCHTARFICLTNGLPSASNFVSCAERKAESCPT
jgi:hypothetical protein